MLLMVSVSWAFCWGSVECIGSLLCWLDLVHFLLRGKIGGLLPLSATYAGGQTSSPNGKVTTLGPITQQDLLLSREREFVTRSTTFFTNVIPKQSGYETRLSNKNSNILS